ncbi:hypothetical protein C9374_003785 [Naegleria lovaniensis]|uniref:Pre-rRNA-processing protein TSR2 homolog n=1 Tax=Naegleria lovaniensis TaxID=51637 RepID=A0AA88H5H9_NAELO|nr:uncharacterized protein C9374_003785 [Naegleria lovaniensis]KAG2394021.1 hypothetical protein C9374_003785 [Naegleria lovaniensis]
MEPSSSSSSTDMNNSNAEQSQLKSAKHNDNFSEYQYYYFCQSVDAIFGRWAALILAKQHHASGDDTEVLLDEFRDNVKEWISNDGDQLELDEIVQYMNDVLSEDLGIDVLDGSIPSVAKHLLLVFQQVTQNNFEQVTKLLTEKKEEPVVIPSESEFVQSKQQQAVVQQNIQNDMEDSSCNEKKEIEVDEDGFQMVKKKSSTRRK